jgi:riboflavin kinase/FMN adenylyltransferase
MTTPDQRCALMAEEGVRHCLILPFTAELARLTPEEFVRQVLVEALGARAVLVGDNFRFGHKQAGDTAILAQFGRKYGFTTEVIQAIRLRGVVVSSSGIRQLIEAGKVAQAARLLEHPYTIEGVVVPGEGIGSRFTVPTLNLATTAELVPAVGVYITRTLEDGGRAWPSITNVGYRPTFGGRQLTVETFLLQPLEGAAPLRIRVEFLRRVREERKFSDPEALKSQILRDVARAQAYFRRIARLRRCGLEVA